MHLKKTGIPVLCALVSLQASAQDVRQCDTSLAPTVERASSEYALAQAYLFVNAEREFDELRKKSAESRDASASYRFFSAEYNDSRSASEFQQRVRDRLTREGFSMQQSEARASYRRFLSPTQLAAWSTCVQSVTNGGSVILTADSVSRGPFPIQVSWRPQRGVGSATLTIEVRGASISGSNKLSQRLEGATDRPFILEPDSSSQPITLTAEIAGAADVLVLPREFKRSAPPPPAPAPPPPPPRVSVRIPASAFMQPTNVALGGPNNIYGADVLLNAPPYGEAHNSATWEFRVVRGGTYLLKAEYAAAQARPVRIFINGTEVIPAALAAPTGCWTPNCQQTLNQGRVELRDGTNVLRVERSSVFPHIRGWIFEPVE